MTAIDILGMTAGCISSITFLPQVIKTWKTKSAADISLLMFTFATISVIMWLVYGIILKNIPIIFTNSMVLLFSLIMLYFKFRYGAKQATVVKHTEDVLAHEY
ncbi:MAG TPA: SemiSWEET transporter [Flavisolibacter sp.]|nr:SemiSWEET transporter [Flavisolibacter sp.]